MYSSNRVRSDSASGVIDLDLSDTGTSTGTSPVKLDALFSPPRSALKEFSLRSSISQSDAGTDIDLQDDDSRFSNVPLSGGGPLGGQGHSATNAPALRSSVSSPLPSQGAAFIGNGRPLSSVSSSSSRKIMHKKSASSYTVGSGGGRESVGNLPFLIQRLDLQKVEEDSNPARRISIDGQHMIQEEFSRLQSGKGKRTSDPDEAEFIDWGECYQFSTSRK